MGTAAGVSAAVVVEQEGLGLEWASQVGSQTEDKPPSAGVQRSQLRLQGASGGGVSKRSWG